MAFKGIVLIVWRGGAHSHVQAASRLRVRETLPETPGRPTVPAGRIQERGLVRKIGTKSNCALTFTKQEQRSIQVFARCVLNESVLLVLLRPLFTLFTSPLIHRYARAAQENRSAHFRCLI